MITYQVKDNFISLGVGMKIQLSKKQAELRKHSLTLKGKSYIVNEPVFFKQGETFSIVKGEVSKKVLVGLENLTSKKAKSLQNKIPEPSENVENKTPTLPNPPQLPKPLQTQMNTENKTDDKGATKEDEKPVFALKEIDKTRGLFSVIDDKGEEWVEAKSKPEAEKELKNLMKE